ncbi:hypothetical protein [Flagellimonas halotolerans]|uniref:Uncharacterized protein n=1 Tax=Flagellimonas halotolerans TaxID=3112164 RepID=A0ABU6IPJ1_9FLAO|nr:MULTISPECIES: hypothetical protein [unclassified Allomuricauda]MEC3965118.1 hypothetical protein [Muricauda sp. SYSU M86414]MEC4265037.1 hypothetical protein [Muricauda sp. SYSU M84420]
MNNQYCKVGSVTPITSISQAASVLEVMHNNFMEKAASVAGKDTQLGEFFKRKAQSLKKVLESLA